MPSPPPHNHIKVQVLAQVASLEQSWWHAPGASQHNEVPEAPGMVGCWGAPWAKALQDPQGCQPSPVIWHKLGAMEFHGTTQGHRAVPPSQAGDPQT